MLNSLYNSHSKFYSFRVKVYICRVKKSKDENSKAKEPEVSYGEKRITFYDSMEEMNEHDYKYYASLSPEESLALVTRLRVTAHPYLKDNLNPWGDIIYFD